MGLSDDEVVPEESSTEESGEVKAAPSHPDVFNALLSAIAAQESSNNYDPPGNRHVAAGKYQVKNSNVPLWSKEIAGRSVTPEEFRANPALQEQVAQGKLAQYYAEAMQKTTDPVSAAQLVMNKWFTGDYFPNDSRTDGNTTAGNYRRQVLARMGQHLTAIQAGKDVASGSHELPTEEWLMAQVEGDGSAPAQSNQNSPVNPIKQGNLDPFNRKALKNSDGSVSTASTISIGTNDGEVLIPTVVDGKRLSNEDAIANYKKTGQHFGIFDTPENANAYAQWLHEQQANRIGSDSSPSPIPDFLLKRRADYLAQVEAAKSKPVAPAAEALPLGTGLPMPFTLGTRKALASSPDPSPSERMYQFAIHPETPNDVTDAGIAPKAFVAPGITDPTSPSESTKQYKVPQSVIKYQQEYFDQVAQQTAARTGVPVLGQSGVYRPFIKKDGSVDAVLSDPNIEERIKNEQDRQKIDLQNKSLAAVAPSLSDAGMPVTGAIAKLASESEVVKGVVGTGVEATNALLLGSVEAIAPETFHAIEDLTISPNSTVATIQKGVGGLAALPGIVMTGGLAEAGLARLGIKGAGIGARVLGTGAAIGGASIPKNIIKVLTKQETPGEALTNVAEESLTGMALGAGGAIGSEIAQAKDLGTIGSALVKGTAGAIAMSAPATFRKGETPDLATAAQGFAFEALGGLGEGSERSAEKASAQRKAAEPEKDLFTAHTDTLSETPHEPLIYRNEKNLPIEKRPITTGINKGKSSEGVIDTELTEDQAKAITNRAPLKATNAQGEEGFFIPKKYVTQSPAEPAAQADVEEPKTDTGENVAGPAQHVSSEPEATAEARSDVRSGEAAASSEREVDLKLTTQEQIDAAKDKEFKERREQDLLSGKEDTYKEAEAPEERRTTGLTRAEIDPQREERGLPPLPKGNMGTFEEYHTAAEEAFKTNPNIGSDLVGEILKTNKKDVKTDEVDHAVLVRERSIRKQVVDTAREEVNSAQTQDDLNSANARFEDAQDKYNDTELAIGKATSKAGSLLSSVRQMVQDDDFSLAKQLSIQLEAVNRGKPIEDRIPHLSPEQVSKVETELKRVTDAYEALKANEEARFNDYYVSKVEALQKTVDEILSGSRTAAPKSKVASLASRMLAEAKAEHEALLKEGVLYSGLDPRILKIMGKEALGHVLNGAVEISEFTKRMGEHWEKFKEHFPTLFREAREKALEVKYPGAREKSGIATPEDVVVNQGDDLRKTIRDLYKAHITEGVRGTDELAEAVQKSLGREDIDTRKVKEIFADYGRLTEPTKKEIPRLMSQAKTMTRLAVSLEDAINKVMPKKSGYQPGKPTQEIRDMMKELRDTMSRNGLETTSPEKQLASRMEQGKNRLRNAIEDIQKYIDTGIKAPSGKGAPVEYDAEGKSLQAKLNELREQAEALYGQGGMSEEARIKLTANAIKKSIELYDGLLKGKAKPERAKPVSSPLLTELRAQRDALKAEYKKTLEYTKKSPEEIALARWKTAIKNRTDQLEVKNAKGDFAPEPRKKIVLDEEAQKLQANYERAKDERRMNVERIRLAGRTTNQKFWDNFVKYRVAGAVSSPITFARLGIAALTREFIQAPVEGILSGLHQLINPKLSKQMERDYNLKFFFSDEVAAKKSLFTQGLADAWANVRLKHSDLETLYKERDMAPPSKLDWVAFQHAAAKAPVVRAEFTRSYIQRVRKAESLGKPVDEKAIGEAAYRDALRAKLQQENFITRKWKMMLLPDKKNPVIGQIASKTGRIIIPVANIPTNLAGEANSYMTGTISGSARLIHAFKNGIENLSPKDAEIINRNIVKGSVGAMLGLYAFTHWQNFGGFYSKEKRSADDVQPNRIRIGDWDAPAFMNHTPPMIVMQFFATIGREFNDGAGLLDAVTGAGLEFTKEIPFVDVVSRIGTALEPKGFLRYTGELAKGIIAPSAVQLVAGAMDKTKEEHPTLAGQIFGEKVQRSPQGFLQTIASGIPGLRQTVPINKNVVLSQIENLYRQGKGKEADKIANDPENRKYLSDSDIEGAYNYAEKFQDERSKQLHGMNPENMMRAYFRSSSDADLKKYAEVVSEKLSSLNEEKLTPDIAKKYYDQITEAEKNGRTKYIDKTDLRDFKETLKSAMNPVREPVKNWDQVTPRSYTAPRMSLPR